MKTLFCGDISPATLTNPLFEKGDIKSLFDDVAEVFNGNDVNFVNLECALTDIRVAKSKNDRVIVIYHGGKEHRHYPSPRLLRACRAI